jgi:hypothetical protein
MTSHLTPEQQVRQLRTTTTLDGATDTVAMQNRHNALEALYHLDGRGNKSHPLHGRYTGLWHRLTSA